MTTNQKPPDPQVILSQLKDFQRRTVEYVFRLLYLDGENRNRFLVADEVGLGKTLVAGIVAKTIAHLWESTKRIDILYICSNRDIAQQNIDRLTIPGPKPLHPCRPHHPAALDRQRGQISQLSRGKS